MMQIQSMIIRICNTAEMFTLLTGRCLAILADGTQGWSQLRRKQKQHGNLPIYIISHFGVLLLLREGGLEKLLLVHFSHGVPEHTGFTTKMPSSNSRNT
jgi:hypothetical protein